MRRTWRVLLARSLHSHMRMLLNAAPSRPATPAHIAKIPSSVHSVQLLSRASAARKADPVPQNVRCYKRCPASNTRPSTHCKPVTVRAPVLTCVDEDEWQLCEPVLVFVCVHACEANHAVLGIAAQLRERESSAHSCQEAAPACAPAVTSSNTGWLHTRLLQQACRASAS